MKKRLKILWEDKWIIIGLSLVASIISLWVRVLIHFIIKYW